MTKTRKNKRRAEAKAAKKKKALTQHIDVDGRPISKKRARQDAERETLDLGDTVLVGLHCEADGSLYLVDEERKVVYDAARDIYGRLVSRGRWDAAARELVSARTGERVRLGAAPAARAPAPAAPAPAPAAPARAPAPAPIVARERAGPRMSKAARRAEKKVEKKVAVEVAAVAEAEAEVVAAQKVRNMKPKKKRRRY